MINIIDVSNLNGTIDWAKVKASGITGAYLKATEGITFTDSYFAGNVNDAHANGIEVGAYHFAHPENDPIKEAQHFLSVISGHQLDFMHVLDLELPTSGGVYSAAYLTNWARQFITYVQQQTGTKVMLYTGVWYINTYPLSGLSDVPLWVAIYGVSAVPQCSDWPGWLMWQYTDSAPVNGISGQVDMSYVSSLDALRGNYKECDIQPMTKPMLEVGSSGANVKTLQTLLNQLGFNCGAVDGLFGTGTKNAVIAFQKAHGLTQDGIVGPQTWAALESASQPATAPAKSTPAPVKTTPTPSTQSTLSIVTVQFADAQSASQAIAQIKAMSGVQHIYIQTQEVM